MTHFSPSALAKLPRSADGEQVLIYPQQAPDERKDILNGMAVQAAYTPQIQRLVRWVLDRLTRRLGRALSASEIAQANRQDASA